MPEHGDIAERELDVPATARAEGGVLPAVVVSIVNYGTAELAEAAVDSLLVHKPRNRELTVHLVDNRSGSDDAARLIISHYRKGWGSGVILHFSPENVGFGRGNNIALNALAFSPQPPTYVMFLNPDAQIKAGTLDAMAGFLDANPDVAIVGASITRPDSGERVSSAFRFPSVASELQATSILPIRHLLRTPVAVALPPDTPSGEADWVTGAAFMARFDDLEHIGYFDPRFFLYFEEVDLMWRVKHHGRRIWYLAEAEAVHIAGAATKMRGGRHSEGRSPKYWYDSWRIYFVKRHGRAGALALSLAKLVSWIPSAALKLVVGRSPPGPKGFGGDFWRWVVWPLVVGRNLP